MTTIVRVLQWPSNVVWPLLFERRIRAREIAQEIGEAEELRIREVDQRPNWITGRNVGYVSLLIQTPAQKRWVHIRPIHFGNYDKKVFDFNQLRFIEFEYCPKGVTDRHSWDPSTYLKIKNAR